MDKLPAKPTPKRTASCSESKLTRSPRFEALVDAEIVRYLRTLRPRLAFMKHGIDGWPDRVICYKGYFIGIEVKSERIGHVATKRQLQRIREIRDAGGIAVVTSSVADVKTIVARIDAAITSSNGRTSARILPGQLPLPEIKETQRG